jgi:hypothetical protein
LATAGNALRSTSSVTASSFIVCSDLDHQLAGRWF